MGSCRKKLLFSTVLIVVDQVMLYPTTWLMSAADMGRDMPVKKMEKKAGVESASFPESET